jgi:hypothetical protein
MGSGVQLARERIRRDASASILVEFELEDPVHARQRSVANVEGIKIALLILITVDVGQCVSMTRARTRGHSDPACCCCALTI